MNNFFKRAAFFHLALFGLCFTAHALAADDYKASDFAATPPVSNDGGPPLVMLALSNDHQLFYKAFTDWDDLNNDGVVESTYEHSIDYAGYFDSYKCYTYSATNGYFSPDSISADKYCTASSDKWSGNFLNWATMTRMDQVRKVLYGGYRSTDTTASTILERAFLPNDAHSFAKYYNGSDLGKLTPFGNTNKVPLTVNSASSGITLCNTTVDVDSRTNNSSNLVSPPLMRAVAGNYLLWAANERWQCRYWEEKAASNDNNPSASGLLANSKSPSTTNKAVQANNVVVGDYIVRVEACKSESLVGKESCTKYPSANFKPTGLVQEFGENDTILFGLLSGSYSKNKSGGVLRKNVGSMSNEVNFTTDGTFITPASDSDSGIIATVNKFRIVNYDYGDGTYHTFDGCEYGNNFFDEGKCKNWGNPFSEILYECYRYFAGKDPSPAFAADDSGVITGLKTSASWISPITSRNNCAKMSVIGFNASSGSYDGDAFGEAALSDIASSKTAVALTKAVGDGEGITGNVYFVGEVGNSSDNQLCTAKTVSNLGLVEGTCPDSPRLDGSYKAAGIAYHVNTNDIRADLDEKQTIKTYGVTLSPALPRISIDVPGSSKKIVILPACRNYSISGNCGLVDFKIIKHYAETSTSGTFSGSFYVNWEDTEQGGDYDQDMSGVVSYMIDDNEITITSDVFAESTDNKLGFGFVISGTTEDGFHALSGIYGFDGYGCSNCQEYDAAASKTFSIGTTAASLLEQPLYYAAKWGGFEDSDEEGEIGSGTPNSKDGTNKEWDRKDNKTGELVPDGIPDNYFYAINPGQLSDQLEQIFLDILSRTSSGSAAAVVSNTASGEGAIYQGLYSPEVLEEDNADKNKIRWTGVLHALFIDETGRLREDTDGDDKLTNSDNVIVFDYDDGDDETYVQRYSVTSDGSTGSASGSPVKISEVPTIWNARDELSKVTNLTDQRNYATQLASEKRYIKTSINGRIRDFDSDFFDPTKGNRRYRYLDYGNDKDTIMNLVDYIRGVETFGDTYRSRQFEFDDTRSGRESWLLGDIIHSSPIVVAAPNEDYGTLYADTSYQEFQSYYKDRRQVVYVGANDGMLHAFNGGFYNAETQGFDIDHSGALSHPLGSELWAFIPESLLPHLKWLADPDYPHVYYMDGPIVKFDVNIFDASSKNDDGTYQGDYPGGWGTIIVASMRLGGADYAIDTNGNGTKNKILRSSYVVFDVTNPEKEPVLLAEISGDDIGFTTSIPTVAKKRVINSDGSIGTNEWYLVFGSGPQGSEGLALGLSDERSKVFLYDLKEGKLESTKNTAINTDGYVGGLTSADWDTDYSDDAIYYGTVSGSILDPKGSLERAEIDFSNDSLEEPSLVLNPFGGRPFTAQPKTYTDRYNNYWVYAGTGRFMVLGDNLSNQQQYMFGIKETLDTNLAINDDLISTGSLVNTSGIQVYQDSSLSRTTNANNVTSYPQLVALVKDSKGWYFQLPDPPESTADTPSPKKMRITSRAAIANQNLIFTAYEPTGLACSPEGLGYIFAPNLLSGVAAPYAPLGVDDGETNGEGSALVTLSESIGTGNPSEPQIHTDINGNQRAIVQNTTGEIVVIDIGDEPVSGGRQSWQEIPITW